MPPTPEEEGLATVAELIEEPIEALVEELELEDNEEPPPAPPPPELVRFVSCSLRMKCLKDHQRGLFNFFFEISDSGTNLSTSNDTCILVRLGAETRSDTVQVWIRAKSLNQTPTPWRPAQWLRSRTIYDLNTLEVELGRDGFSLRAEGLLVPGHCQCRRLAESRDIVIILKTHA